MIPNAAFAQCVNFGERTIPSVDLSSVKRQWLTWVNAERAKEKLPLLTMDGQLTHAAVLWSNQAADNGAITHKRPGQTVYYDYKRITQWFTGIGIAFANEGGSTFSENIGWGVVSCPKKGDCTPQFTLAVKTTLDFFMGEKGKAYAPHYDTIMNPAYHFTGVGITMRGGRYYLTAEYATKVTSKALTFCTNG